MTIGEPHGLGPRMTRPIAYPLLIAALLVAAHDTRAQDRGTVDPKPLPPLANPNDPKQPARELFGRKPTPAPLEARSIGFYARGCLAGGVALPVNGQTRAGTRPLRNRTSGHAA